MTSVWGIVVIAVVVSIDNALLTGLLMPHMKAAEKRLTVTVVGILLAASQILLAASVDQLLNHIVFRFVAIGLLSWMCIRTLHMYPTRDYQKWWVLIKLWIYTVVGNLDNMIWLGSELKGDRVWLIVCSVVTIPLFVAVALFLSDQCEKQQWILPLGAGMMAWAAAALMLDIPTVQKFVTSLDDAPRTTFQCLITIGILAIGIGMRQLLSHRPNMKRL